MADLRAIEAVAEGVFLRLRQARSHVGLDEQPEFKAVTAPDMAARPVTTGVTLLIHELVRSRTIGLAAPPDGPIRRAGDGTSDTDRNEGTDASSNAPIDLEMRFLLSIWASSAQIEQRLASWVISTIARAPTLTADELNAAMPDCFSPNESISIVSLDMPLGDQMAVWNAIGPGRFRLSLPFMATGIRIDRA